MTLWKNLLMVIAVICLFVSVFCTKEPVAEEGDIIFSDEFTDSLLTQWSVSDTSKVSVSNGKLLLQDDCNVIAPSTSSFQDYSVEIRSKITGELSGFWGYGLMFRVQDEYSCYIFQYDPGINGLKLTKNPGDHKIVPNVEISTDTLWHNLKVMVFSDSIECYLDGDLKMAGTDDNYSSGAVGLCIWNGLDAEFDWIKVREIEWK